MNEWVGSGRQILRILPNPASLICVTGECAPLHTHTHTHTHSLTHVHMPTPTWTTASAAHTLSSTPCSSSSTCMSPTNSMLLSMDSRIWQYSIKLLVMSQNTLISPWCLQMPPLMFIWVQVMWRKVHESQDSLVFVGFKVVLAKFWGLFGVTKPLASMPAQVHSVIKAKRVTKMFGNWWTFFEDFTFLKD